MQFFKRLSFNKNDYRDVYLKSPHWLELKAKLHGRFTFCQMCRSTGVQLDIHHITYDRLGFELMTDLIVLCHKCHFTIDHKNPAGYGW